MGARSETFVVSHPYPVVLEGLAKALPTEGFSVGSVDPAGGRIEASNRRHRVTVSVGAIDAITTEWVADVELKIGLGPDRYEAVVGKVRTALDRWLDAYFTP